MTRSCPALKPATTEAISLAPRSLDPQHADAGKVGVDEAARTGERDAPARIPREVSAERLGSVTRAQNEDHVGRRADRETACRGDRDEAAVGTRGQRGDAASLRHSSNARTGGQRPR